MSTKAFFLNSDTAQYGQAEINGINSLLLTAGVLNTQSDDWADWLVDGDMIVTQHAGGADMSVDVATGWIAIATTRIGQTFKLFAQNGALVNVPIASNSSGSNRVDAIIARISRSADPDVSLSNILTIERVAGTGVSALSDGAISSAISGDDFIRLANVTVPNAAVTIVTANIADTRTPAKIGKSVRFSPESLFQAQAVASSAGALSVNFSNGEVAEITLTENITSATLSGGKAGGRYYLRIKQHASAPKTVVLGTAGGVQFSNDIASYVMTPSVDAVDVLEFLYDATASKYNLIKVTKGFQSSPTQSPPAGAVQVDFGDGSDGAINLDGTNTYAGLGISKSGNTYTLSRDIYATTLIVAAPCTLDCAGYRVFALTSITNAGLIHNKGGDGANAVSSVVVGGWGGTGNAAGGTAGKTGSMTGGAAGGQGGGVTTLDQNGGAGAAGGNLSARYLIAASGAAGGAGQTSGARSGGAAGAAGTSSTAAVNQPRNLTSAFSLVDWNGTAIAAIGTAPASGGGGCSGVPNTGLSSTIGGGGGGGGSGGIVFLASPTISNSGTISAAGGNGGNAANHIWNGGTINGSAGGGAGNGGCIIMIYTSLANTGTITANAGVAGTGGINTGSGGGTLGASGGSATNGKIIKISTNP